MINHSFIVASIGLVLSATAFAADDTGKAADKPARSAAGDSAATAIAQCDKLTGPEKATCLKQAREASSDRSATGATTGGAAGKAGTPGSATQQPKETAPGNTGGGTPSGKY
jgi:hypothetical protein